MIGTITIKVNAAHPQMPLCPFYAHKDSPSQVRIIDVPKAIGKWKITSVQVSANYPDNTSRSAVCSLDGGCWHATLPGSAETGQGLNGFKVTASGVAEDGETAVVGYVLGKGDIFILDDDSTITIGETTIYVHIVDAKGENPHRGDLFNNNGRWEIFDGTEWVSLSGTGDVKHSDFEDIPYDLDPEESTLADTMTKLNLVIKRLREGVVPALALLFSMSVFADYPGTVDVQKAKLANLPGKAMVVTNVVNALPFPNDTVAPGLILSKSTNGVEWIVNPGGGGSLGPIAYITGKSGDISNKNFRVIAEKNPAGQIVASIEQVQFDPEMKTVEEEEARAFQKEMTLNYMITNEVARATNAELDLDEKIRSLSSLGRFISTWNTASGRPGTEPKTTYLEYKGGDYYLVTAVSTNGAPNYIPNGTVYTNGTSSASVAPDTVNFNDIYRHADDGTWIHVPMAGVQTTFEQIAGEPTNNVKLAAALADGRMSGETATNIAHNVAIQLVDDDYLATPSVTNGLRHVLNMDAYNFTPGEWTKTNTDATVTVAGLEVPAYTSLAWNGSKWICYDSAAAATVDMLGSITDPNAYTLGFPNGEITDRPPVLTVYSRLATTNDLFALEGDIIALLAAETNRAYTAETNLAAQIVAEHDRAYTAETNLVAELVAETNRAQTVESDLDTRLVAETNRAQAAEADIDTRLVAETNRAQTVEADIDARLIAETNRAQIVEAGLDARLVAETNRAQTAEAAIAADLAAEVTRATGVEGGLRTDLVAETNRAQVAEADIRGESAALDARLVAETNRAQLAEADLGTRIDDEDARAQTAEQALDAKIVAETNRAQVAEAAIAADLAAEVTRATGIEGGIRTDLTAETNRAQIAEAAIAADLAAEVTRATGAEAAINTRLVAETNRAQIAEASIASDLAAEVTRATGIEGGLRTDLTAEIQRAITNEATKIPLAQKGAVGGVATLDVNKSVPMSELPSDVKNYAVYANTTSLPRPGSANTIYLTTDDNALYRYDYTGYIKIGGSGALTNVTWGTITGTLANQTDLNTVLTNHDQRITAEYNRAYTVETNLAANVAKKQDQLPTPITDYYLHANEFTGELEWKGMSGGDISNYNHLVNRPIIEGVVVTGGINLAAADLNLMTNLKYTAAENGKVLGVRDANLAWVDGGGAGGDYRTKTDMTYYIEELFDISAIKAFVGDNDIAMWLTDEDLNEHGDPNDQWIYTIQKKDGSIIGFSDTEYNGKATALAQTSVTMTIYPWSHTFTVTRKSPSPAATGHKLLTDNYFTYVIPTNRTDSHKVDMIFVPDEVQNIQTVQSRSDIPSWDDTTNRIYVVNDDNSIWRRDGSGTWKKIGSSMDTNAVQYIIDQNVATNNIVGFEMFEEQVEYLDEEIARLGREKRGIYDLNVSAHFLAQYSTVKLGSQVIPSKDITIQKETYGYHVYAYTGTFIGTNICYVDDKGVLTSIGASITLGGFSPTVGTKVIVPAEEIAVVSKTQTNLVYSAAENGKVLGVKDAGLTWVDAGGGSKVYINGSSTPSASANVWTPTNGGTNEMILTSSGLYGTPKWAMKGEMKYIREPANYDELFTAAGLLRDGVDWTGDILGLTLSTNSYPVESGYFKLYNQGASFRKMILQSNTMRGMWQNTKSYGTWLGWERIDERVVDNLTSTASDMSLSARQGKILSEGKQNKVSAMGGTARPVYVASSGIFSACGAFVGESDTPVYMKDGTITQCSTTVGSANKPAWVNAGKLTACSNYGGGTQVTLNNTSKAASTASFYAPTSGGTEGQVLISNGTSAPTWENSGMKVVEIFSGSIAPEKTGTLSVSYNNFKLLVVGWKNPTGHIIFTPVINPGSYTTTSSDIQVSTDTAYCIFYFPSTTSIKFKSGTSSSSIAKVYGIK